ncbi:hypothetical protein H4582DRAFT_2060763 [Lactarius indigo]|nr:hypothetical protein H4582DRAFT_2060763 [Lactarius indigo]
MEATSDGYDDAYEENEKPSHRVREAGGRSEGTRDGAEVLLDIFSKATVSQLLQDFGLRGDSGSKWNGLSVASSFDEVTSGVVQTDFNQYWQVFHKDGPAPGASGIINGRVTFHLEGLPTLLSSNEVTVKEELQESVQQRNYGSHPGRRKG